MTPFKHANYCFFLGFLYIVYQNNNEVSYENMDCLR